MSKSWPKVRLGEVLRRSEETILLEPDVEYREVTVKLWGKGVVPRGTVSGTSVAAQRRYVARASQFILSRIDARNGAIGIVPSELDGAIVSNDFPTYDLATDRLLPAFLGWMCRTAWFVEACQRVSEGTTNRVRLKEDLFLGIEIPLPSLEEQRRIVTRIEELAARIDEARALRQQSSAEGEALIGQARAKTFEEASSREQEPLESLAVIERGKFSHRPRNASQFFGGEHRWIQIAEIERSEKFIRSYSQTLNDDGLAISKKFPKGTVLVSIAATIGAVGILDFDCCVPDSIVGVTPRTGVDSEFLYHFLSYVRTHLEGIAPQSAQKNINLKILSPLPVPKLTVSEQRRLVVYLNGLQEKVAVLKYQQIETTSEFDALLPTVLNGVFVGEL